MSASSSRSAIRRLSLDAIRQPLSTGRHQLMAAFRGAQFPPSLIHVPNHSRSLFSFSDLSKLASLAQSPPSSSDTGQRREGVVESDGEEQRYYARKILPYSPKQLYRIVSDVPSYSSFIPFCQSSTVSGSPDSNAQASSPAASGSSSSGRRSSTPSKSHISRSFRSSLDDPYEVDHELKVGFGGFEEAYISRVVAIPFESVTATAVEGGNPLFKKLITKWSFLPASSKSPHPSNPSVHTTSSASINGLVGSQHRETAAAATSSALGKRGEVRGEVREPNDISTLDSDAEIGPTLLTIDMTFNFTNPLHRIASQAVLPKVADKMVEAFEKRCMEVWGKGTD